MDSVDHALTWIFGISLVLILLAYYVGTVADVNAFGGQFNNLLKTLTGRNAAGNFAAYPTGG